MKFLLALMSVGSALGYGVPYNPYSLYNPYQQRYNFQSSPYDGLLAGASSQAVAAYSQIVQNFSQSLADIKTALERWAKTYGLEQQYQKFMVDFEEEDNDSKKAINDLLPKVLQYLIQCTRMGDERQSINSVFERTSALPKTLDDQQKAVAKFIRNTYMPSAVDRVPRNQGNINGDYVGNSGPIPGMGRGFQGGPYVYPSGEFYRKSNGGFPENNGGFSQTIGGFPGRTGGFLGSTENFPKYNEINGVIPTGVNGYPRNNGRYANGGYASIIGGLPSYNGGYPMTTGGSTRNSAIFTRNNGNNPNNNRRNTLGEYGGVYGNSNRFSNSNGASQNGAYPGILNFGSGVLQGN